jgi:hypothetical protein
MPETGIDWAIYGIGLAACFFAPFLALLIDRRTSK